MEETYIINGGRKLSGEIEVEASKNAFLPVLAGSVLVDGEVEFLNTPEFSDIHNMCEILKVLNIKVNRSGKYLKLNTESIKNEKITHDLTNKLRASIFLLGPLLSKFKEASISYPGGCNIGTRPIDIHLSAFRSLGVKIVEKHGYIYCNAHNMKAGKVVFSSVSVGATESVMMSAIFLKGKTTLYNVAREPEIRELARFLNEMGAKVYGAGGDAALPGCAPGEDGPRPGAARGGRAGAGNRRGPPGRGAGAQHGLLRQPDDPGAAGARRPLWRGLRLRGAFPLARGGGLPAGRGGPAAGTGPGRR